jgi:hypothetical protein
MKLRSATQSQPMRSILRRRHRPVAAKLIANSAYRKLAPQPPLATLKPAVRSAISGLEALLRTVGWMLWQKLRPRCSPE